MNLKTVLIAAILLLATTFPLAAQTATRATGPVTYKRRRPVKRKPATPPVPSLVKTLPSGLSYIITRPGEGRQPLAGEIVRVNYTGLLSNGMKFDSSLDSGQPFSFQLGAGQVIKGWDEGIAQLRVGTQATFIIPPQLGYGARGRGPIPPNATLIFILELVGIEEKPTP